MGGSSYEGALVVYRKLMRIVLTLGLILGPMAVAPAAAPYSETERFVEGPTEGPECSDGFDNDDDGLVDYPEDPGCTVLEDDVEADGPGVGVKRHHYRKVVVTGFTHVYPSTGGKPLRVNGHVRVSDGFASCATVFVEVQTKTRRGWTARGKHGRTDEQGSFSVPVRDSAGRYRVIARKVMRPQEDDSFDVCHYARSRASKHRH